MTVLDNIAIGAWTAAAVLLRIPWPDSIMQSGLLYPLGIVVGILAGRLWSMLFGLPSARIKGFYTIMTTTTMAVQFDTVDLVVTHYVSMMEGRVFSWDILPSLIRLGPIQLAGNNTAVYLDACARNIVCDVCGEHSEDASREGVGGDS